MEISVFTDTRSISKLVGTNFYNKNKDTKMELFKFHHPCYSGAVNPFYHFTSHTTTIVNKTGKIYAIE